MQKTHKAKTSCKARTSCARGGVRRRLPRRQVSTPTHPPTHPPLGSRCATLSRGNFRVGDRFVCTGRGPGGGDGGRALSPPSCFLLGH